jgi:AcrR family transcriptional regulator
MNDPARTNQAAGAQEPRERILAAAEELFSARGYSAIGVRELATQADVNIAMISYYFGSKQGVLEELINRFFDLVEQTAALVFARSLGPDAHLRELVGESLALFAAHPRLVRIALTELTCDATDLARLKTDRIQRLLGCFEPPDRKAAPGEAGDPQIDAIRGPAMFMLLASHFLIKPVLEEMGQARFDAEFYRKLTAVLADLLTAGLRAVATAERAGRYTTAGD